MTDSNAGGASAPSVSKSATVAIVLEGGATAPAPGAKPLKAILSDDREITYFESLVESGETDPLARVLEMRARQQREDEEFGDYVEELLSRPFLRPEVQEHAVQWLKSKIRIEQYQRQEAEAARIIADYACQLIQADPSRRDFVLKGPTAQVRIRVFEMSEARARAA